MINILGFLPEILLNLSIKSNIFKEIFNIFISSIDETGSSIIKYSTYVIDDNPIFTSDSQTAIAKLNKRPGDYTNTDYALTKAYNLILDNNLDASKTSVVLMTDGIPTHYFKNPTGNERSIWY